MLVLSRKAGESIMVGKDIELIVLSVEGDNVRIGIKAPKQIEVFRKELYESIQLSNTESSGSRKFLSEILKPKKTGEN